MRHRKKNVGLNRTKAHRRALLANLASALFTHKKIRTTLPKAKAVRPYAERLITFAKKGDLSARREVLKKITQKPVVKELFEVVGPKYRDRDGGYTRIIRLDNREGDNAPMALLELVGFEPDDVPTAKKRRRRDRRTERKADAPVKEAKVEEAEEVAEAPAETTEEKVEEAAPEAEETTEAPVEEEKAEETVEETPAEEAKEEAAEEKQEDASEDKPEESEEGEKKE